MEVESNCYLLLFPPPKKKKTTTTKTQQQKTQQKPTQTTTKEHTQTNTTHTNNSKRTHTNKHNTQKQQQMNTHKQTQHTQTTVRLCTIWGSFRYFKSFFTSAIITLLIDIIPNYKQYIIYANLILLKICFWSDMKRNLRAFQ